MSRARQLYPAELFEQLFERVFALCVAQGLVAGDTQALDSAPVKANAALESLQEKRADATVAGAAMTAPAHQLRNEAARQARRQAHPGSLGATYVKARVLSNKTHYRPTDPGARISVKPGKAQALNYLCNLAVDSASGVISHVQANFADSRDSLHLPGIVQRLLPRLRAQDLLWCDVLADAGYANGFNYAFWEERGLTPWIPVFGQYKLVVEGFAYDAQTDCYMCAAGKLLPFQKYDTTADGSWLKIYWAAYQDCKQCPLKATCVPTARRKQLTRTAYDPAYRRAWARQQSRRGQLMRRRRRSTVEPVFGSLIHHYGLRRVNTRGKVGAHNVRLSTDGGLSYPTVLAAGVPNTGAATVTVPHVVTPRSRVLVEAADNYFFAISNADFAIATASPCAPPTALAISGVGNTAATLGFAVSGGATQYEVTTWPATTTQVVSSGPVSLSGLRPGPVYSVQVVSRCGPGSTSTAATASAPLR